MTRSKNGKGGTFTQQNQLFAIETILGQDVLLLQSMSGWEAISALFRFDLVLVSENDSIDLRKLLGTNATLHLKLADGSSRHWNGHFSRISQGARSPAFTTYHAEMVPWFWFLTLKTDCRIFQEKNTVEIVKEVLGELGFRDYEFRLREEPPKREYCVQYRESNFNFLSRLLEEEGIFYFFEHKKGKHTLVMANQSGAHSPCLGTSTVTVLPSPESTLTEDIITDWRLEEQFVASGYSLTDYNFQTPSAKLAASVQGENSYEVYDYPGLYPDGKRGEKLTRIRREQVASQSVVAHGESNCRGFSSGHSFRLRDHYRRAWNQEYVLIETTHHGAQADYFSGSSDTGGFGPHYGNGFVCIPRSVSFRPARRAPVPVVEGCQTAVVVGPPGEEVHTDKFGRVKVQFHWDRRGQRNERSSCWIRVSQNWAGKGWGSVSIPRIGQEVIVDFLEGNPDRPIIVGRVYNADQTPPYPLPGGAANMGFKSKSIHGGGYNEISINDTNGREGITIHAQYDMRTRIEHNDTISVGNDRAEKVGKNETVTIALLRTHNVGVNDMLNVGAAQEITVGGAQAVSVGLARAVSVGMMQQTTVGLDMNTNVGKNYSLEAGDSITLKTGASSITLKSDGTIVISGKDLRLTGSGSIVELAPTIDLNPT